LIFEARALRNPQAQLHQIKGSGPFPTATAETAVFSARYGASGEGMAVMTKGFASGGGLGSGLGRRDLLKAGLAGAAASVGSFISVGSRAEGLAKVNFQIAWVHGGNQIGEVCAKRMGFYEQEGIELNIVASGPNIDGMPLVAAGRYEIGQLSSSPSLMVAASQNVPVKCFAVGAQQHPHTYFSTLAKPIRTPGDMVGKRIGVQATGLVLLRALLARNGIDQKDVTIVTIGSDLSPLVKGEVDAVTGWLTNTTALKVLGADRVELRLWDSGVRLYAHPYYATAQTIRNRPELLARFVRATAKGWEYAFHNRDKAVGLLIAEYPHLNVEDEGPAADVMVSYAFNETTRTGGWGVMDPTVWADQIELFAQLGLFPKKVPTVDDLMSLDILKATRDDRPRIG
jgi:NitT/TauT family transport system substrate-binding protein